MSDIKELKTKFSQVQQISQNLKEEKIRLESEIKTLTADYDEQLKSLLDQTNTTSLEEAQKLYEETKQKLEADKTALEGELDKYLKTYGEENSEVM